MYSSNPQIYRRDSLLSTSMKAIALTICLFFLATFQSAAYVLDGETIEPRAPSAKDDDGTSRPEQLTVIAPDYLRPSSDYHVLVSLANSSVPATIDLQLIGARDTDREQVEAKSILANSDETQLVKFQVGAEWPPGRYFLSVNAQAADRSWNFTGEQQIGFQAKVFSAFIQTDKAIYKPGQLVQFRALFLTPDLTPLVINNSINVTIGNPRRNIIKQWHYLSNYRGLLSLEMALSEEPMLGDYEIEVTARDQKFTKQFTVAEYVLPTFDVTIDLPPFATFNESNVVATVRATYTYEKPVQGHVTLTVQPLVRFTRIATQPLESAQFRARLDTDGKSEFHVDIMRDLKLTSEEYFEREIEFFALVEEDLTERKYNRTRNLKVHVSNVKIERLREGQQVAGGEIKPGLKQTMRYKVAYQDDTPVEDSNQLVELEYKAQTIPLGTFKLRPVNGLIEHELLVPGRVRAPWLEGLEIYVDSVDVTATYRKHRHSLMRLEPRQSDSGHYLQIVLPQLDSPPLPGTSVSLARAATGLARNQLSVGDQLRVLVRATEPMQQVTCQGLSRGDIVWALNRNAQNRKEFGFEIKLEARTAPESRILCFYTRPSNKELIGDSRELTVTNGLVKNFAKLSTSRSEAKPGQKVEVGVFTKPNSLVGVLALDQSVLLLKSGNDLSQSKIIDELKSYGGDAPHKQKEYFGASMSNMAQLFHLASVVVLTNNHLFRGRWPHLVRPVANPYMILSRDLLREESYSGLSLGKIIEDPALPPPEFHLKKSLDNDNVRIRSLFPETWLWENGTADAQGQARFSSRVPDTITSWQLSAFSLNEAHGLALSQGRTAVRVFRPFFVKLNLPYAIIRGETVVIQAIVSNHISNKRPLEARVVLENKRGEFEFVETAANTIEDEKHSSSASWSRFVRLPADGSASVSFLIKPIKLGHIDIKVVAQSDLAGDGIVKKLLVKAEGQTQHFNKPVLIQLPAPESTWRQNVSIQVPANAVPGSQRVHVSAIGDVLGAGLSNLDDLLRLPYGCGEQNMINLVPNLVVLNYLQKTGRLRDVQRERALKNIETGYQRQLNYRRLDGSFSAFGLDDSVGSVWLTAYVLKTLKQATPHTAIDKQVLSRAAEFIEASAQPNGSFEEMGMLHNKALASAAADSFKSTYLTAYALGALLARPQTHEGSNTTHEVIERGLAHLEQQLASESSAMLTTYELAMIAHVLELASGKHQEASNQAYEKLWARAIDKDGGEQVHWSNNLQSLAGPKSEPDMEPTSNVFDTTDLGRQEPGKLQDVPPRSARQIHTDAGQPEPPPPPPPLRPFLVKSDQSSHWFAPNSLDVEMTSWALLTAVKRNEIERALPIVRWLVAQQNSLGGYGSTQDTVLAIEALAAHAEATNAAAIQTGAPQSIVVEFIYPRQVNQSGGSGSGTTASLRKTSLEQMLVTKSSALALQQTRLPDNITWVSIQASGVGSAVVQVSWQYNLLVSAERPAFYLNPMLDRKSTVNYLQLNVCAFYKGETSKSSNMAVVEVELPSGYAADLETLASLKRNKLIKRVDTRAAETQVLVYLDRLGREELCFTVPAHRSSKVANNKPVPVTIYDYYDRKQAARIFYQPQPASSCDICDSPDECGKLCGVTKDSYAQTNERLSLHEQRKQNLNNQMLARLTNEPLPTTGNSTGVPANSTSNLGLPDAYQFLPISTAFSVLNQAARDVHIR